MALTFGPLIFTTEVVLDGNIVETAALIRATRRGRDDAFANEQELIDATLTMDDDNLPSNM